MHHLYAAHMRQLMRRQAYESRARRGTLHIGVDFATMLPRYTPRTHKLTRTKQEKLMARFQSVTDLPDEVDWFTRDMGEELYPKIR